MNMKMIYKTNKTVPQAVEDLQQSIAEKNFGVLHIHNLYETLNKKGVPFDQQCQVLDVCNPQQAAKVLLDDMDMNMALPCRISVYEKDGCTYIGMLSPKTMLSQLSDSETLQEVANEVEQSLLEAINNAL
jgi:uncharacterized protein (DUF302 family)